MQELGYLKGDMFGIIYLFNVFIVDDKNTTKKTSISTNVTLNTWLI